MYVCAVGDASGQGLQLALGWKHEYDWMQTGFATASCAAMGGLLWRPTNAPVQEVCHWGGSIETGRWVQTGPPTKWNWIKAGVP